MTSGDVAQKGREAAAASTSEAEGSTVASSSLSPSSAESSESEGGEGHGEESSRSRALPNARLKRALRELALLRREKKRWRRQRERQRSCNRTQREGERSEGAQRVRSRRQHEAATEATDDDGRARGIRAKTAGDLIRWSTSSPMLSEYVDVLNLGVSFPRLH